MSVPIVYVYCTNNVYYYLIKIEFNNTRLVTKNLFSTNLWREKCKLKKQKAIISINE